MTVTRLDTTSGPLAIFAVRDVTERQRAAGDMERTLQRERRAAASGGKVWFDTPVDGGSQFSFTLPAGEPGGLP